MKTEKAIQTAIVEHLKKHGAYVLRLSGRDACLQSGTPDLLAVIGGRHIFIEVKRPGEGPTPIQSHRHEQIKRAGGTVIVARSVADVEAVLKLDSD